MLGRERKKLLGRVYERWVEEDVEGALESLGPVGAANERSLRAGLIGRFWAETDSGEALAWIESGAWRASGLGAVANGVLDRLIGLDPRKALALSDQEGATGSLLKNDDHLLSLAFALSASDPQLGWEWVMAYPEAGLRMRMLERLASDAVVSAETVGRANELPDSEMKRRVMRKLIEKLGRLDPEAALGMVGEQPAGQERTRAR